MEDGPEGGAFVQVGGGVMLHQDGGGGPVQARQHLLPAVQRALDLRAGRLAVLEARLGGLDPTKPLERGFVLATDASGRPVTSSKALAPGSALELRWKDGARRARLA